MKRMFIVAAAAAAFIAGAATTGGVATAAPGDGPYAGGSSFVDNTLGQADMYTGTWDYLLKTNAPNSVWTTTLNDNVVAPSKLHPSVRADLEIGKGTPFQIPVTTIDKIGGPFATNATVVGTLTLQPGLYSVTTSAKFDRINADHADYEVPNTDTMPTLALRFKTDDGGPLDGDAGTIMGAAISKAGYTELTGSSVASVRVSAPTTITVYGFGYNENRSAFGSVDYTPGAKAQFSVGAKIVADRIG